FKWDNELCWRNESVDMSWTLQRNDRNRSSRYGTRMTLPLTQVAYGYTAMEDLTEKRTFLWSVNYLPRCFTLSSPSIHSPLSQTGPETSKIVWLIESLLAVIF
ncbi:hypothetical protein PENTCL1PPCAC_27077, partial [Pristionchus entomophagus]